MKMKMKTKTKMVRKKMVIMRMKKRTGRKRWWTGKEKGY
jgi:hypothetical protein